MTSFPIRCFTCGKCLALAGNINIFREKTESGEHPDSVLDSLRIRRMCCRRMFLSNPFELEDNQLLYETNRTHTRVLLDLPKVYPTYTITL